MKYKLICTRSYETVVPASRMIFSTIHGSEVDAMEVPEYRFTTHAGNRATATRKAEVNALLASGNWQLESA